MAFNKDQLKQSVDTNKENNLSTINHFIQRFTDAVESEKFEDWLQKQLEYTTREYRELSFYMGMYSNSYDPYYFFIGSSDDRFSGDPAKVRIKFGHKDLGKNSYKKEQNEYLDAMSTCWKILKQKLKALGLSITTSEPNWVIVSPGSMNAKKIELELIEED